MAKNYQPQLDWIRNQVPEMSVELLHLSNINSGSYHAAGVNHVAERLEGLFGSPGAKPERLDLPPHRVTSDRGEVVEHAVGRALRLRKRPEANLQVFLAGLMDTVFSVEHPFQSARVVDDD